MAYSTCGAAAARPGPVAWIIAGRGQRRIDEKQIGRRPGSRLSGFRPRSAAASGCRDCGRRCGPVAFVDIFAFAQPSPPHAAPIEIVGEGSLDDFRPPPHCLLADPRTQAVAVCIASTPPPRLQLSQRWRLPRSDTPFRWGLSGCEVQLPDGRDPIARQHRWSRSRR